MNDTDLRVRLPKDLKEKAAKCAKEDHRSLAGLVRRLLQKYVDGRSSK